MHEWPTKILQEVCDDITVGHVGSMASQYTSTGVPFLRSQNVRTGRLDLDNLKYIPYEFHERLRKSQLTAGDIVIVRTGEPGAAALIPDAFDALNCSDLVIVRPGGQIESRYLCYAINATAAHFINSHLVGAVQQHFNVASARKLQLRIPPIATQRAIVGVLGALDDKIAANDRIAATTRILATAQFERSILAGDTVSHRVAELTELLSRGVTPRYTEELDQLMILNQKCVRDGRVLFHPARRTQSEIVPSQKLLVRGDVLVNSTGVGTLGRVSPWTYERSCTVDSHITIVRFDAAKVDPVCAGFAMLAAQPEIEALGEGSTGQTELNRARLGGVSLTLPSADVAATLRPLLVGLDDKGNAALEESITLSRLRDTLLPKLMWGEIRVREAEKVVEEVT